MSNEAQTAHSVIYTVGHSKHSFENFAELLARHSIQLVIDVRTHPRSRFAPWSTKGKIEEALGSLGIEYDYMGDALGGHPDDEDAYDKDEKVVYERIAYKPEFRNGITKVLSLSEIKRLALMCTEGKPQDCHRHPLLARQLIERGAEVVHIRPNGRLVNAESLKARQESAQMALFELAGEDTTWKSPKRIRRRRNSG
jgi:uncharacterized protein (DUF488 family)